MATKFEELRQSASSAWDEYAHEMAKFSDENLPTAEQAAHIDELRQNATGKQRELHTAEQFAKDKADFDRQQEEFSRANKRPPNGPSEEQSPRDRRSIGQRFTEFGAYQEWVQRHAPNGRVPEKANLNSPPLHFGGLHELNRHAELLTGESSTSGGGLIVPDQYGPVTEAGRRPLTIRRLITNLLTDSDTVEFVRITEEDNQAGVVPEASATDAEESGAIAGTKPESGMNFERVSTPVKTIAHWMPATTRVLSDAPQLRGLIDSFLQYGVDEEVEDQIVTGSGVGDDFDGILETDGVQVQEFLAGDAGSGAFFRTARTARRKVRTVGRRRPTAYVLHPEDWEQIDLAEDSNKRFYSEGPFGLMQPRLWGLPVVESEAVPQGTGLVGDFSTCVIWDRQQASISVSNSHSDFFIRNLIAILCELRAAFGVLKPNALVQFSTEAES